MDIRSLATGGRLFLISVRQLARGELQDPAKLASLERTFAMHALPEGLPIIQGTLAAVTGAARRRLAFNDDDASTLLPDEQCLLACLAALQAQPNACACHHVQSFLEPSLLALVMPFLVGTARVFESRKLRFTVLPPAARGAPGPGHVH